MIELNINASSLRNSSCLLHWFRTIGEGYCEPIFSDKIVYGIAVHKFLDVMYQSGDMALAKEEALKVFRQKKASDAKSEHMSDERHFMWTCFDVWNNYAAVDTEFQIALKPDGKPATEVTFSIPFHRDDTVNVNLCGTIDKIGKFQGGCFAIGDWKSTSTPLYRAQQYLDDYDMKSQLRFYLLSLKLMNRFFPDSQLGKIGENRIGAFIDGIFIGQKPSDLKIKRSAVFQFPQYDLDSFEQSLLKRIKQLSSALADGTIGLKEGIVMNTCEMRYSKCSFYTVCRSNNPQLEEMLLKRNFIKKTYDPLHRDL